MEQKGVHHNKIVVALANKLARITWVILTKRATLYLRQPEMQAF